ncbi:MAG: hypothetical protein HOQ22_18625, partial [Nocardioidaceae bacterium]|nr:hypothetical protein [Nocardioidaceae bacterium]
REHGLLLPGARAAHYQARADLRGGVWNDGHSEWPWDRMVRRSLRHDGTVLISEEMLGAATREQAESAVRRFGDAEVHVVVAVRDLWRSVPSAWQQSVRARTVGTFADFVARIRDGGNPGFWDNHFPVPILERWGTLVPPERRHVVTVPAAGAPRSMLWQRFCSVLGLEADDYAVPGDAANPSLGAPEAELLRRVNAGLGDDFPLRRAYLRSVHALLTRPVLMRNPAPERFGAPIELAPWVEQRSKELAEELATYPCHLVGSTDDLLPTGLRESRSPDEYDDTELLDLAVHTIVGMVRHSRAEMDRLHRAADAVRPTPAAPAPPRPTWRRALGRVRSKVGGTR